MPWEMQVLLYENPGDTEKRFVSIRPTGGTPYRYETQEEAERMLRICYPDQLRDDRLDGTPGARVRVVEVTESPVKPLPCGGVDHEGSGPVEACDSCPKNPAVLIADQERRFILWDPRDGGNHPPRSDMGVINTEGVLGMLGVDNVYLNAYAGYPNGRTHRDLAVGEGICGVRFHLSGETGYYDVYRVR